MNADEFTKAVASAAMKAGWPLDGGVGQVNIVYVEGMDTDFNKNANTPNQFNDIRCIFRNVAGAMLLVGVWEATTEPSRYWTQNPMNPGGAARIAFGRQKCWQVGYHHGNKDHEALVQTGGQVKVYRDRNKDFERDGDKLDTGDFGINQHHGYDLPHGDLGKSSAGCLVGRMIKGHREFMSIVKSDPRYMDDHEYVFSTIVMPAALVALTAPVVAPKGRLISQDAEALIIATEVGDVDAPSLTVSRAAYEARYRRPDWPGGNSGLTIGIGYDVGAGVEAFSQLQNDWAGHIPTEMILAMRSSIGVTGTAAKALSDALRHAVDVPWDAAIAVFENIDIPRWYAICKQYLPNFEKLSPDQKGALVSLAFNRGPTFDRTGHRYDEMRRIKQYMIDEQFDRIPQQFRAMKRLWEGQGLEGLLTRREAEAKLFERGLSQTGV